MMITRRQTLHRIAMGGVAVFVGTVPGARAIAQPLPRRREINSLGLNDPIVQTFRDGVKILKARTAGQGPSWNDFAAIHGSASAFNKCPHRNWYFLPWHRAYLLSYERMIRSVTGNASFALPYWDWAANRAVPQAFSEAQHGGQDNPLFVATRNNSYSAPDSVTGPTVMNDIFAQTNFELFASSRPPAQNNLNASWITSSTGTQGKLESTPHNLIHGNLGGFMGQGNSPRDPIFLMHHGNIDRIWWRWNCRGGVNTADALWRDMPFTNNYFNPNGSMATFKPSELLSVSALGYSYGLCLRPVIWPRLRAVANLRLVNIFRAGRARRVQALEGAQLLQVRGRTANGAREAVGTAPPRTLRNTFLNLSARPPAAETLRPEQRTSQIVALIHELAPPSDEVEVLVFAGSGPIPPVSDPSDPRFVTVIGFFGAHAHHDGGISASVDLTEHLRRMGADSDQVHVRLVPRARERADVSARSVQETVARAEVEVIIV